MTEQTPQQQSLIIGGMSHMAPPKRFWTPGKVVFFLILFGCLGVGGYYTYTKVYAKKKAVIVTPTYEMKLQNMEISVTEEGTLESLKSLPVKAKFGAQCKIEWIIPEETVVKEGDVVLKFDVQELDKAIEDLEVRLKEAEASLVRSKEDDVIARREDEAALQKADKDIQNAKDELDKFLNSDVPRKREEFKLRIRKARQSLREIETDIAALPFLIEKELKTLNDLEKAKIELETRKNSLQTAEEDYRIYLEYELPRTLAQKREAVENAIRNAERTRNNTESRAAQRLSQIRQSEKNLESTKSRLDENKLRKDMMVLTAPAAGVVYYGGGGGNRDWYGGDDIKEQLKPGNQIWTGQDLMNIPDTSKMKVTTNILESDISKIKLDLPAIITVPALDDASYTGKVSFKARSARPMRYWDPSSSKVVSCEILIDDYDERLTPGSTVKCKIVVKMLENVLAVPVEYVFEKDGHPVVYVKTGPNDMCEARRIKLGDNNSQYVVVEAGLKVGEEIYQYAPSTATDAPVVGEIYKSAPPSVSPPANGAPNGNGTVESPKPEESGKPAEPSGSPMPKRSLTAEEVEKLKERFKNRGNNGGEKPQQKP